MINLRHRSSRKELLDEPDIPATDLYRNLSELDFINTYLGGHAVTCHGIGQLTEAAAGVISILDIGSGGGDTLKYIAMWGRQKKLKLELTGVDLKPDCIDFASKACAAFPEISFIRSDYRNIDNVQGTYDIIISSLFCHHLDDNELVALFKWMKAHAQKGFIVNDLHRHHFAFYSIKWLTALFSSSYLVKNDAPVSVTRGFRKRELKTILAGAEIDTYSLEWKWAFRWLLVCKRNDQE